MNAFKALSAVLPGLAFQLVSRWVNLFLYTYIAYPNWQIDAQRLSIAIGTFVAIIVCLLWREKPEKELRWWTTLLFWATVCALFLCLFFWWILGRPFANPYAVAIQDIWFVVFVLAMTLLVATISVGSLSITNDHSKLFWAVTIVAAVAIVLGAILIYFVL